MKNLGIILTALTAAFSIYWLTNKATRSHATTSESVLVVGTNAEFPPFTTINEQNQIVGFDIDIATEVAKKLNKTMEIKDRSFDMLIPEAQNGSVHIIAAGMTATPERAKQLIFTKPYLKGEPLVVVTLKKNPITSIDDLNGKSVVVNEGYTADTYMSARPEVNIKRLPAPAESILELQTEKSFAYVSALNAVKPFLQKFGEDTFNVFKIAGTDENTAMGISKHYPELLEQIQLILDQMEADGTIEELKKKWNLS
jgi:polar amino acid transport system substrate-binding protein